jgi:hypothetical protein
MPAVAAQMKTADFFGRDLVRLGGVTSFDNSIAANVGVFIPIFQTGLPNDPANGIKETVVVFVNMENWTGAALAGPQIQGLGSGPGGVDWFVGAVTPTLATPTVSIGNGTGSVYAPGVVFGFILQAPQPNLGQFDLSCYGWSA